jgi:hypothetical protein
MCVVYYKIFFWCFIGVTGNTQKNLEWNEWVSLSMSTIKKFSEQFPSSAAYCKYFQSHQMLPSNKFQLIPKCIQKQTFGLLLGSKE